MRRQVYPSNHHNMMSKGDWMRVEEYITSDGFGLAEYVYKYK